MAKRKQNPRGVQNVEHSSPVNDESATTKYAKDVEHTSPVDDEDANTKYARDVEHSSPVDDENANTKYAKDIPSNDLTSQSQKRIYDLSMEETITNFKNQVERNFSDYSSDQRTIILTKIIDIFGINSLEINKKYFKDKY